MTDHTNTRFAMLKSGGVVRITSAIMAGAGAQGPQGSSGPQGVATFVRGTKPNAAAIQSLGSPASVPAQGDAWIAADTGHLWVWDVYRTVWTDAGMFVGRPGYLQSLFAQVSHLPNLAVAGTDVLVTVPFSAVTHNDTELVAGAVPTTRTILTVPPTNPFNEFSVASATATGYQIVIEALINTTSAVKGRGRLVLRLDGQVVAQSRQFIDGQSGVDQSLSVVWTGSLANANKLSVAFSSRVACRIDSVRADIVRFGGGTGPMGMQGITGAHAFLGNPVANTVDLPVVGTPGQMRYVTGTGHLHAWDDINKNWVDGGSIKGDQGNASSGFSDFDDISNGSSDQPPTAGPPIVSVTTDQGVPYPSPTHSPNIPYFLKTAFEYIERRVVGRFTDTADYTTKRPTASRGDGGVVYIKNVSSVASVGGNLYLQDVRLTDDAGLASLAFSKYSTSPAPATTKMPNGTLWLQV
jgi:hypothetical protein